MTGQSLGRKGRDLMGSTLWSEHEMTVRADELRVGDYLYVGHHWWGEVKALNRGMGLVLITAGGMEHIVAITDDHPSVLIRRAEQTPSEVAGTDSREGRE